ncbi:TraB/GumN family protein [Halorubellus sp. JP-L1]|uniref:TraB/GumN family protein n=1 Tax=Halorubellus sp. JP-L1 TaxID=2715753 RepID=UPI00140BAF2E|nr:TraB/GumN family protein [Halorubellus sp. JP-L1]NHN40830.1 TraB/GumN family protein [Halorubellus sp. JP-L1]
MTEAAPPTPGPTAPEPDDGEGSVHVLGTAHVSQASVDEVERTIEDRHPDVVAVELDEGRYRQLRGETPDDLDPTDLLSGNTVFQFIAYWMLSYVQARLGDRFDVNPGADMLAAVETAEANGLGVALVDRDIQTTIQRFWKRMTVFEKIQTASGLAFGAADPRLVGITVGLVLGVFLAPLLGFGLPLAGVVTDAGLLSIASGGLVAGVVGYAALTVTDDHFDEWTSLLAATAVGVGVGAAVAVTGVLDPYLAGVLVSPIRNLLAGGFVGIGLGVAVGVLLGVAFDAFGVGSDEEMEEFDIEQMTDSDVVTVMMEEFRQFSPGGASALIDERDAYIAHNLVALRDKGYDVVAVVGAGHRAGIQAYLDDPASLPPMDDLVGTESGSRFSLGKLFGYLLTLGFVAFFGLLVLGGANDAFLLRLFAAWFLFNGAFAFVLTKLAGGHWRSAGVAGAVAWMTSLNPLLAPGWFAGYVELKQQPVNVSDIGTLNEILNDHESPLRDVIGRMFDVPLFRLIMVVAAANVGSLVASVLFPVVVLPALAPEVGGVQGVLDLLVQGVENGVRIVRGVVGV